MQDNFILDENVDLLNCSEIKIDLNPTLLASDVAYLLTMRNLLTKKINAIIANHMLLGLKIKTNSNFAQRSDVGSSYKLIYQPRVTTITDRLGNVTQRQSLSWQYTVFA